jgi:hypothetical protein
VRGIGVIRIVTFSHPLFFLNACGVLERSRPTGLLGSRHQLPRVFPGGSHETRLPQRRGNLTTQQTDGLALSPLHTNLVDTVGGLGMHVTACLRDLGCGLAGLTRAPQSGLRIA